MKLFLFTDWASRSNPWESGGWFIAFDENKKIIFTWKKYFWIKTNNQSEYLALIEWIKRSLEVSDISELNIFMDSELIVNQLNWSYKVKNKDLKPLFTQVVELLKKQKWTATHIERWLNKDADKLAHQAIDFRSF